MAFSSSTGQKRGAPLTLKNSAAETASTTGAASRVAEDFRVAVVTVAVTASAGTSPTLLVVVEGSSDGSNFFTLGTIGSNGHAVGAIGTSPATFTTSATARGAFVAPEYIRYRSVITGSAGQSFTYSVQADLS